jgi:hypothetical protein
LNLELPRSGSAGPMGAQRPPGLLPLLQAPPERRSRLSEEIEKAGKADCRTAHADKGLLAVVPLAGSVLGGDKGCRW